jgi:hypothetical protein
MFFLTIHWECTTVQCHAETSSCILDSSSLRFREEPPGMPGQDSTYLGVGRRANNFATPHPDCAMPLAAHLIKDGRGVTTKWWGERVGGAEA